MSTDLYKFKREDSISIRDLSDGVDEISIVDFSSKTWDYVYGGKESKIDWASFSSEESTIDQFKGFLAHRLETRSPRTVDVDYRALKLLDSSRFDSSSDHVKDDVIIGIKSNTRLYFSLQAFLNWAIENHIVGKHDEFLEHLRRHKPRNKNSYEAIYLRQYNFPKMYERKLGLSTQTGGIIV